MRELPVRDDFPVGFCEQLGSLFIEFGRLEYLLKLCIKDLTDSGFTSGMVEAEHNQFSTLCKEAKKWAQSKLEANKAGAASKLFDEAETLGNERNDCVHAFWTTNKDGVPLRIRPKKSDPIDWSRTRTVTLDELRHTYEKIKQLCRALDKERLTWRAQ
jgi:hypothetical protein